MSPTFAFECLIFHWLIMRLCVILGTCEWSWGISIGSHHIYRHRRCFLHGHLCHLSSAHPHTLHGLPATLLPAPLQSPTATFRISASCQRWRSLHSVKLPTSTTTSLPSDLSEAGGSTQDRKWRRSTTYRKSTYLSPDFQRYLRRILGLILFWKG